jgi:hypothetical protein
MIVGLEECSIASRPLNSCEPQHISFVPRFPKTLSEKKRRRSVVVLKVLRARKAALTLGFKTFWCTDMGDLACSYGGLALRPEKAREFFIWYTDMGDRL